jgi:dihydrodipicolinate reductase
MLEKASAEIASRGVGIIRPAAAADLESTQQLYYFIDDIRYKAQLIEEIKQTDGVVLDVKLDKGDDLNAVLDQFEVLIDFTRPEATLDSRNKGYFRKIWLICLWLLLVLLL